MTIRSYDAATGEWTASQEDAPSFEPVLTPAEQLAEWRPTASLPKAEFVLGLASLGILTEADAVSASRGNWPAAMTAFLDYLTPAQAAQVQIEWATRTTIWRMNTFVLSLASFLSLPDATVDTLFGWTG